MGSRPLRRFMWQLEVRGLLVDVEQAGHRGVPAEAPWRKSAATIAVLVILTLALGTGQTRHQPYAFAGGERDFRVEWEQLQTRVGPAIAGYIYNDAGTAAAKVSVLIEGLDGTGHPVNATIGYVIGTVPALGRAYFEVRVPSAISYRVSIASFDWMKGGGGGGM